MGRVWCLAKETEYSGITMGLFDYIAAEGGSLRQYPEIHGMPAGVARPAMELSFRVMYSIHMKRTNLMLDEDLLEEAVRMAGAKTYSGAGNMALRDVIRRAKARRILELAGTGLWNGDLAAMRKDRPKRGAARSAPWSSLTPPSGLRFSGVEIRCAWMRLSNSTGLSPACPSSRRYCKVSGRSKRTGSPAMRCWRCPSSKPRWASLWWRKR